MAITGRFEADFAQFTAAVDAAEVKLRSFETGSAKVETALTRMTNSFSGRRIIQDATLMVEAVERIGGTSKLTEGELARLGTVAAEAVEKMRALGMEVPANLEKVAAAAKQVGPAAAQAGSAVQSMTAQLADANKLLGAFGVGLTIGGVVSFGRDVLAAGDHIQKMSDQTNLSTEAVQRFQFIAGQSGTSMDSLVGAVQNLQQKLGANDKGLVGAFAQLNISLVAFKQLNAYEQMTTLGDAVRSVEDPTTRAQLAADLFGKSWKEILPAILAGMRDVGNQAPVMADDTVKSLDRIGDKITETHQRLLTWGGALVTGIEQYYYQIGNLASAFNPEHIGRTNEMLIRAAVELNDPGGLLRALEHVPPVAGAVSASLRDVSLSAADTASVERELTDRVKDSITAHEAEAAALKKVTEAQAEHDKQIQALSSSAFGGDQVKAATDMAEAIGRVENVTTMNAEAQAKLATVMDKGIAAMLQMGLGADPMVARFAELYEKAVEYTRALEDLARVTAAETAEQKRLNDEMERAFKGSGGTDREGFRGGLVGTGRSPMAPSVGLKPSVFASGGVAGVNTPGTYGNTNVNVSGVLLSNNPSAREELRQFMSDIIGDGVKLSRKITPF